MTHARRTPCRHRFSYDLFSLCLDLDELPVLDAGLRLFAADRGATVSFRAADHGPSQAGFREPAELAGWLNATLAAAGLRLKAPRHLLVCFPRILGYGFSPLSVFYCYDGARLAAAVCEVNNTFGQRTAYVLPAAGHTTHTITGDMAKALPVSPFLPLALTYRMHLPEPGAALSIGIRAVIAGDDVLVASYRARRLPLTDANLLRCIGHHGWVPARITAGIHWQALCLWGKGLVASCDPTTPPAGEKSAMREVA